MTNQNNSKKELSVYQGKLNHGVTDFYDRDNPFLLSEIKSVKKYPNLSWAWKNDIPAITGTYFFKSEYKGTVLEDSFRLSITFPQNYPYSLPHAFELDGKIESNYHHFLSDGSLCLGTEIDLYKIFAIRPCLDTFMTEILNPYLYRWLYIKRFGKEPWADRGHGNAGIIESYAEALEIPPDKTIVKDFLAFLAEKKHEGKFIVSL